MTLPEGLLEELNALGLALVDEEPCYTFFRPAIGGDVFVRIEPLAGATFRVGVILRPPREKGRDAKDPVPLSLASYGGIPGVDTIDFSAEDLVGTLPRLLEQGILPALDMWDG